jgi:hypothetical protein
VSREGNIKSRSITMPFNELQRRDSWPPTVVRLCDDDVAGDADPDTIDENPFAYFLTSPDELDDFFDDDEDLSAGIETPDSAHSPVREVSPSALQRASLDLNDDDDEEEYDFGLAMPVSLKEFTTKHNSMRKARAEQRKADGLGMLGLGISLSQSTAARGRAKLRLVPTRGYRGRGQTRSRSLSARRPPQSWREPSPEIFSIKEERESDEDGKSAERMESDKAISSSAPTTSRIGVGGLAASSPVPISKPKKKVHWAF